MVLLRQHGGREQGLRRHHDILQHLLNHLHLPLSERRGLLAVLPPALRDRRGQHNERRRGVHDCVLHVLHRILCADGGGHPEGAPRPYPALAFTELPLHPHDHCLRPMVAGVLLPLSTVSVVDLHLPALRCCPRIHVPVCQESV